MTVKEILEIENANTGSINLFKEGILLEGLRKIGMEICKKHQGIQGIQKICKSGKAGYRVSCIS